MANMNKPTRTHRPHAGSVSIIATTTTTTSSSSSSSSPASSHPSTQPDPMAATPHASPSPFPSLVSASSPALLPRLIVFDLDYTLWPFWVDTHVTPPLKPTPGAAHASVTDRAGDTYAFYPDVPPLLAALAGCRPAVRVAAASRTAAPDVAREMLKLLVVPSPPQSSGGKKGGGGGGDRERDRERERGKPRRALDFFDAGLEIYPGSKLRHMEALRARTGVPFAEMLFFDDEKRNREVESLGVTMCLVSAGMSWGELQRGIEMWRARRGAT
ncbi:hypothetical protein P8C59_000838 [Phyllachora maydis]|uniref:Magnesium-dependent phosphatase 1 n=1 Tax=Phyllachora maydis TaxID=1825666 RepID=A0AAD9HYH3_9PEZI|nr:hypothetical protein P8C59_000838 [Phyllachora maydis]